MQHRFAAAARLAAVLLTATLAACGDSSGPSQNPVPHVSTISPTEANAGSGDLDVAITGSGFVPGSVVRWNGADRPTRYGTKNGVTVTLSAADLASPTTGDLRVFNAAPGGGTSNLTNFPVRMATPVLASSTPSVVAAGSPGATLTLAGSYFVPTSQALIGGALRSVQYVSGAQLRLSLSAADVASPGTIALRVYNPVDQFGGYASGVLNVEVR